jgi:CelD/BcsL family acetyltransferase involved in cellulose biosynthesis
MQWRSHPVGDSLGAWTARWEALNQQRFDGHPLLSATFVNGLLRHFPAKGLRLCVAQDDQGQDVAMALLCPRRLGVWAVYLPSQMQIAPLLWRAPAELKPLLRCLPGLVVQLDLLALDPDFHGDDWQCGGEPVAHRRAALTMHVQLDDAARYWSGRSKKLRDNMKRLDKLVTAAGHTTHFVSIAEAEAIREAVHRYAELENLGWKGRAGTALAPGNQQHRFYESLLLEASQRGQAHVFELWLGPSLVASRLLLAGPSMVVALKTAFREDFRTLAPGRLLLREALFHAHVLWPKLRFDFYTNASSDQLAWATHQREMQTLTAYRSTTWRHLAAWRGRVRHSAARSVDCLDATQEWPASVLALFAEAQAERIGHGAAWLQNLAKSVFAQDGQARVYVLMQDGHALAALPVVLGAQGKAEVQALSNYYTTLYAPVLAPGAKASELAPLVRAVLRDGRAGRGVAHMQFGPMEPASPAFAALRDGLRAAGLKVFDYFCHGNWYEPVTQDADAYLAAREGQLRSTIKRSESKLTKAGARIEILHGAKDVERGVQAFQAVYERSWKKPEPYPDFMPGLIRLCAREGWMRLGLVWLGEVPIAAQLWIVANDRAEIYKLAYDEAHKTLAPGTVLTARLMRHVIDVDRVREIDYLIGDEPYKQQWMGQRRERWGLLAFNPRHWRGLYGWLREGLARQLRPRARAAPPASSQMPGGTMPPP